MKLIKTEEAVGHILCHDLTRIVKEEMKEAVYRKGHIVTEEDIPILLSMGKENLYVWEKQPGMLHENDAAEILYKVCAGNYMKPSPVKEGKIEAVAEIDGLLKVDKEKLFQINRLGNLMIATRHGNFPIKQGDHLAGTRIIPLIIESDKMETVKSLGGQEPILSLLPFQPKKVAIVTTGSEVYKGRIKDTFTPVIIEKLQEYPSIEIIGQEIVDDDHQQITQTIQRMIEHGANFVICTGGMSVDPDDRTPLAIKNTGADIISYGAPVLPGAMFLLAYKQSIPIVGLPGCVMYAKRTIFDLILPRILADDLISADDLAALGYGGLCLNCPNCTFPQCSFGRGA